MQLEKMTFHFFSNSTIVQLKGNMRASIRQVESTSDSI